MGYYKHVFGDDMNAEEKARLDHAELFVNMNGINAVAFALRMHHDRFYGKPNDCVWCREPAEFAARQKLETEWPAIAAAFDRPAGKPEKIKVTEPEPAMKFNYGLAESIYFDAAGFLKEHKRICANASCPCKTEQI